MTTETLAEELGTFFERYNEAFASIDGKRIAVLYHAPTLTMRADGSIHCLQTQDELARFFQGVAETYRDEGYRKGRFKNLQIVPLGGRSALATMDWELQRSDGSVIRAWRQSYNVVRKANPGLDRREGRPFATPAFRPLGAVP
jgi:hypothetical protein